MTTARPELPSLEIPEEGHLARNILHFARALRRAGLPVGPDRAIGAIRAVEAAGFSEKADFYWTLHACFVSRPQHRPVFAQLFRLYWRDPRYMEQMMSLLRPSVRGVQQDREARDAEKRAAQALLGDRADDHVPPDPEEKEDDSQELVLDATGSQSARERLRSLDFEQMSLEEMAEARRVLATLSLPVPPLISRRMTPDRRGRLPDWRASLRDSLRSGGEMRPPRMRSHGRRWPNLVVLCDISGSMSQYSRAVLHFVHAVSNRQGQGWAGVHAFTFGTELTNVTRHMGQRDVDAALRQAGARARDWEGGTRIGAALHAFNRDWSRRVLGQGAVVLLITDGLDRDAPDLLDREMRRLRLSARRLIWLNPLLRWDGFAARATGIRTMLPHVDSFRAGHNIASFDGLARALSDPGDMGEKARLLADLAKSENG